MPFQNLSQTNTGPKRITGFKSATFNLTWSQLMLVSAILMKSMRYKLFTGKNSIQSKWSTASRPLNWIAILTGHGTVPMGRRTVGSLPFGFFNELTPYSLARSRSTLYVNPWANLATPLLLQGMPTKKFEGKKLISIPGTDFATLFGIDSNWPKWAER